MPHHPLFIALEGLDGSGTTTQCKRLINWLRSLGREAQPTREPSDGAIGRLIRQFLRGKPGDLDPNALALLFAADRLQHIEHEIRPALQTGSDLVSDRYLLSSLAYQSIDCGLDWVREINCKADDADLTIFLEVSPETCINRIQERSRQTDGERPELFERLDTLTRVDSAYHDGLELLRSSSSVLVIDGTADADTVTEAIRAGLSRQFSFLVST